MYNPAAAVIGGKVALLYRAQGTQRTRSNHHWRWPSVIGLAWSGDGIRFTTESEPVFQPQEQWEEFGVEDPRVVDVGRGYAMTYTAYDGQHARLAMTTTSDRSLHTWNSRFLLFPLEKRWTKAGALLAERVNGQYYLYFQMHELNPVSGETHVWLASSVDLHQWEVSPRPVLTTRRQHFDDHEIEPGPPPLLLPEGVLLIYNGAKVSRNATGRTFGVGWALFDRHDPSQVIARCEQPFLRVEHSLERKGRAPHVSFQRFLRQRGRIQGTIIAEGLVFFQGRWLLYYGMGDTAIGVAVGRSASLFTL